LHRQQFYLVDQVLIEASSERLQTRIVFARRVWVAAGGRCTFCKEFLADDETTGQSVFTGQLAHIVGATAEKKSPRGASSMPLTQRALPDNLMLVCPGEHKVIDTFEHWSTYGEDELRAFKEQHERDIRELTGLLRKPKSTVIRVSGDVRGRAVDFSKQEVIRTRVGVDHDPIGVPHFTSMFRARADIMYLIGAKLGRVQTR
jgi:hypothetical protein